MGRSTCKGTGTVCLDEKQRHAPYDRRINTAPLGRPVHVFVRVGRLHLLLLVQVAIFARRPPGCEVAHHVLEAARREVVAAVPRGDLHAPVTVPAQHAAVGCETHEWSGSAGASSATPVSGTSALEWSGSVATSNVGTLSTMAVS